MGLCARRVNSSQAPSYAQHLPLSVGKISRILMSSCMILACLEEGAAGQSACRWPVLGLCAEHAAQHCLQLHWHLHMPSQSQE